LAGEILRTGDQHAFEVIAYVFMPDHLHMLLSGCSDVADFRAAMTVIRQRTAVTFRRATGQALWQDGYFERVLRREEQTFDVVRYILWNPVRANLVRAPEEYPYSWSAFGWDV
jgi:putative transposase